MSELNDKIRSVLLDNGFVEGLLPDFLKSNMDLWRYKYCSNNMHIYFNENRSHIFARHHNGAYVEGLHNATAEQVIAYFQKHSTSPKSAPTQTPHQLKMQLIGNLQQALLDMDFYFYQCNLDEMYHDKLDCTVWFDVNVITVQHGKHDRTDIAYDAVDVHGAMIGAVSKHLQGKQ